ncbi:hypothetical protein [Deinococcus navajonensis]|uniref:Uncharacterized protein n=1 Tax=Deinococcus navajonensis TaxID=309884 RepID=A0ABV8XQF7_9DEIO
MNDVMLSGHAVARFQERFAGNLSWAAARERLRRLLRRARFMGVRPGRARMYALGEMRFIVQDGMLVTVYRPTYAPVPIREDLWCLGALAS